ncbi:MAG: hypothetical protein WKF33_01750 [Thermoleophilaceae bacterium]
MKLTHDAVLVVARISDERRALAVTRKIRPVVDQQGEAVVFLSVVLEWLVVRAAPIDAVEVEPGGPEVQEPVDIVATLELTRRIERQIVIDELPEIDVASRQTTAVLPDPIGLAHGDGELTQDSQVPVEGRIMRWAVCQPSKHPAEATVVGAAYRRITETAGLVDSVLPIRHGSSPW